VWARAMAAARLMLSALVAAGCPACAPHDDACIAR
jgi:hypothetical protein